MYLGATTKGTEVTPDFEWGDYIDQAQANSQAREQTQNQSHASNEELITTPNMGNILLYVGSAAIVMLFVFDVLDGKKSKKRA